ncbi:hypothetical protein FH972_008576 [Carpinus fangiana]|uniref:SHSP domain-containing protein n=1 Tax=Carpinus fangiana TaxID=176857 RepID=A0A5N6QZ53_9ROSI|nr:hypothetical protein FH972_008576 [Carpinus fangiana]
MSSILGGGRYDPFSLDGWDPLGDFHFKGNLAAAVPHAVFPNETTSFVSVRMDWKETPEAHVMKAVLPGLKKDEVKVKVEEGNKVLSISGERKIQKEEKTDKWHVVEDSSGKFLRRFRLPENARADKVTTLTDNGVLTVTIPKLETKKHSARVNIDISGH